MGLRKRQLKVSVTEIREPGTGRSDRSGVQTFGASASVAMAARGGEQASPQIDVDPGELDVFGSVEVTFALEG